MYIPDIIISIATFPGIIIHRISQLLFCRISRIAVSDVGHFKSSNPRGYIVHEQPKDIYQLILLTIGPFLFNTLLGAFIAVSSSIPILERGSDNPMDYLLLWLGISIAMHAFPNRKNIKNIWSIMKSETSSILTKVICFPFVLVIYIFSIGSYIWLDLVYGYCVVLFIPKLVLKILA